MGNCCAKPRARDGDDDGVALDDLPRLGHHRTIRRDREHELAERIGGITGPVVPTPVSRLPRTVTTQALSANYGEASTSYAPARTVAVDNTGNIAQRPAFANGDDGISIHHARPMTAPDMEAAGIRPPHGPLTSHPDVLSVAAPPTAATNPADEQVIYAYVHDSIDFTKSMNDLMNKNVEKGNIAFTEYRKNEQAKRDAAKEQERKKVADYVAKTKSAPTMHTEYQKGEQRNSMQYYLTEEEREVRAVRLDAFERVEELGGQGYVESLFPNFHREYSRYVKAKANFENSLTDDVTSAWGGETLLALASIDGEGVSGTGVGGFAAAAAATAATSVAPSPVRRPRVSIVHRTNLLREDAERQDRALYDNFLREKLALSGVLSNEPVDDVDHLIRVLLSLGEEGIKKCLLDEDFLRRCVQQYNSMAPELKAGLEN